MEKKWYVVYIKANCEKKVASLLTKKNIENYYPLNRATYYKRNKKKILFQPLFPSFVFIYISDAEIATVRKTNAVINFVYWLGNPVVVTNDEIDDLQHFANQYSNIKLERTAISGNAIGRFINEPHVEINYDSNVILVKNSVCKLLLPSMGFILKADIEKTTKEMPVHSFIRTELIL